MNRHAHLAKLTPPRLPAIVERPRLYRLLDRARRRQTVWINAPPGFGKTTLVAGYLRTHKLRSLWYQLDEGDDDLATFFHYLGLAVQKGTPRLKKPLAHLTPEYLKGLSTFTRRFFEELYRRLRSPVVLVFDNYQEVPVDAALHEMLALGISSVPPGVNILVISRTLPPAAWAQAQARQQMNFIGEESLRLTEQESRSIVRLHKKSQRRKSHESIGKVHDKFQGWVAGLVLQLEQAKTQEIPHVATPQVVFDYLAREVLQKLSLNKQSFLLHTAFLPDMTAATAARLTGEATAGDILEGLYQSRYFTERRMGAGSVYQYHPLFKEFLRSHAKATLPALDVQATQQTAATLLEEAGRIEDAVLLYQEAGETDQIVRMILSKGPELLAQGRAHTLEEWIRQVPTELRDQEPWLLFWLGSCRLPFNPLESEGIFAAAFEHFKALNDTTGMCMAWSGAVSAIQYSWLDIDRLDRWIDLLPEFMPPDVSFPSVEIETQMTFCIFTALMWRRPQRALMNPWIDRAKTLIAKSPDLSKGMALSAVMTHLFVWIGDFASAEKYNDMLGVAAASQAAPPLTRMLFYENHAVLAWNRGDAEVACRVADEALAVSQTTGVHLFDAALLASAIYGSLLQNDLIRAEHYLAQTAPLVANPSHVMHGNWLMCHAWLARLKGDTTRAWDLVQQCSELRWVKGTSAAEAHHIYAAAILLHPRGDPRAHQYLDQVKLIGEQMGSGLLQFMSSLLEAHFALDEGREEAGLAVLREALAIGREKRFSYFPWWIPQMMARLCVRALEADIEVDYVRDLIRKTRLVPDADTSANETWPWPVKIYTLGRFEIHVDGKPLPPRRKAPYRVLTLLKAMIALGGREIPTSRLIDALWPDAEGDVGEETFHKTLQRLRHLVCHEGLIQMKESKVSLNRQHCWVDAMAFQTLLNSTDNSKPRQAEPDVRVQRYEQAIALYRGPFLEADGACGWADRYREGLRQEFVQAVQQLSEWKKADGTNEAALTCLENGVEADPLAEPLYPRLIRFLFDLDRQSEAKKVLVRYHKAVIMAGREPSVEMQRLAKNLSAS
ncbi:MAG: BTAD domain-containing putative transcriptional regulator [Nitrospira sp.]|nr:BTAD domain-containing putative transcriptional regulator [Nitrospira sp.]